MTIDRQWCENQARSLEAMLRDLKANLAILESQADDLREQAAEFRGRLIQARLTLAQAQEEGVKDETRESSPSQPGIATGASGRLRADPTHTDGRAAGNCYLSAMSHLRTNGNAQADEDAAAIAHYHADAGGPAGGRA